MTFLAKANDLVKVVIRVDKLPFLAAWEEPANSNWVHIEPHADKMGETRHFKMTGGPGEQVTFGIAYDEAIGHEDPDPQVTYTITFVDSSGAVIAVNKAVVPKGAGPVSRLYEFSQTSARVNVSGHQVYLHVEKGDALSYPSDVLVLKYAQAFYGVDQAVARALSTEIPAVLSTMPSVGAFRLFETGNRIAASRVLFLGVPPLGQFRYLDIREFSRIALEILAENVASIRRIAITVHGPGFGLDEMECFEALVAGLLDGLSSGKFPASLADIAIVERVERRAESFDRALDILVKSRTLEVNPRGVVSLNLGPIASERIRAVGYASEAKPLVFVAMPFREDMMDHYDYGIRSATERAGFLCERSDQTYFTGDILARIKNRIEVCRLLVADLSFGNPNVYLEVGYAWGRNKPTILLKRAEDQSHFDVQGQNCLVYKRIKDIEDKLYDQLTHLHIS